MSFPFFQANKEVCAALQGAYASIWQIRFCSDWLARKEKATCQKVVQKARHKRCQAASQGMDSGRIRV